MIYLFGVFGCMSKHRHHTHTHTLVRRTLTYTSMNYDNFRRKLSQHVIPVALHMRRKMWRCCQCFSFYSKTSAIVAQYLNLVAAGRMCVRVERSAPVYPTEHGSRMNGTAVGRMLLVFACQTWPCGISINLILNIVGYDVLWASGVANSIFPFFPSQVYWTR